MSSPDHAQFTEADRDRAFLRLLEAIESRWDPAASFEHQVATGIRTSLRLLAADPHLAELLAPEPAPNAAALARRLALANLLRDAAEGHRGLTRPPFFIEPLLLDGVHYRIARHYREDGAAGLETLLPSLTEFLLTYYLDPHVVRRFMLELGAGIERGDPSSS
jgi:hypothetical protein